MIDKLVGIEVKGLETLAKQGYRFYIASSETDEILFLAAKDMSTMVYNIDDEEFIDVSDNLQILEEGFIN